MKNSEIDLSNPYKNILDGELLWKFLHLSTLEKAEMAKRIGTNIDQVSGIKLLFTECTKTYSRAVTLKSDSYGSFTALHRSGLTLECIENIHGQTVINSVQKNIQGQ